MFKKNIVSLIIYFYSELNASSHISPRFSHRYIPILSSRSTLYIIINKKGTKFLMPKYLNMIFSNIIKIIRLARCDTRYNMKYKYTYIFFRRVEKHCVTSPSQSPSQPCIFFQPQSF